MELWKHRYFTQLALEHKSHGWNKRANIHKTLTSIKQFTSIICEVLNLLNMFFILEITLTCVCLQFFFYIQRTWPLEHWRKDGSHKAERSDSFSAYAQCACESQCCQYDVRNEMSLSLILQICSVSRSNCPGGTPLQEQISWNLQLGWSLSDDLSHNITQSL